MEEEPNVKAIIYVITCTETGLRYVGQTKTHKRTRGKLYTYGIAQRFVEHVGSSRRGRTTPIAQAIAEYGEECFEIEEIKRCSLANADKQEARKIKELNTLAPNGYNVQESSRSTGGSFYTEGAIVGAEIRGIREGGVLAKVRLFLDIEGVDKRKRVMFGTDPDTYQQSILDAKAFCDELGCVPIEHNSLFENTALWWPYKEKVDQFDDRQISRLRIIPFSSKMLVRVCVKTEDMTSWKEEVKMTFGGKNVPTEEALEIAKSVCKELKKRHEVEFSIDKDLLK
jgi:hypothetical protein